MKDLSYEYSKGCWVTTIDTRHGSVEIVVGGTNAGPREDHVNAVARFVSDVDRRLLQMRRQLRWGFLYRPIRIAVNDQALVGVQFRNRLTGYQGNLILESPL